jgi:hypothetical protein
VKELRQALQSGFVVAMLLLFLLVRTYFWGSAGGSNPEWEPESVDFRQGAPFSILHLILLALHAVHRLTVASAAERTEVHVDLLFISALQPRAILSGKYVQRWYWPC